MFTGIVEETGKIKGRIKSGKSSAITISCKKVLEGTIIGDSIAVNGVCLTVTNMGKDYFEADVMNETLSRSTLGDSPIGSSVNLERAMPADGRFGGHIVSGHIDGTGIVRHIKEDDNAFWYKIGADKKILKYIVEKGSIAINGISLTVANADEISFEVSVIPHTRGVTGIGELREGSVVNLECDIIGKYVERLISFKSEEEKGRGGLTREFLLKNGF